MKKDICICYAVLIQPLLVIFQHILIYGYGMSAESTTIYRVALTAVPMVMATVLSFMRSMKLYITTYCIIIALLLLHSVLFPDNAVFIFNEALRYTLPVVVPSCLCIVSLKDIHVFERCLTNVSWIISWSAIILVGFLLQDISAFETYSMSLSYALLLPTIQLFFKGKGVLMSLLLFAIILIFGSRGAVAIIIVYVSYYLIFVLGKTNLLLYLAFITMVISVISPNLISYLDKVGFVSRTLLLMESGDFNYLSGRDLLYNRMVDLLLDNPILGIGLFGDRVVLDGAYCHNIILEVFLNWGCLLGFIMIAVFVYGLITIYIKTSRYNKHLLVKYVLMFLLPLMVSSSYLINYNFGLLLGLMVLIKKSDVNI